jgi:hypothetical protein
LAQFAAVAAKTAKAAALKKPAAVSRGGRRPTWRSRHLLILLIFWIASLRSQ